MQDLASDSASIRLELDPPADGRVEIEVEGPENVKKRLVPERRPEAGAGGSGPVAFAAFRATGLTPKTAYRYRVLVADKAVAAGEGAFTTAPPPGDTGPFSFILYGDNRSDDGAHAAVAKAVAGAPADFLLHTGDFVEDGSDELQWQRCFEIERALLRDRCVFAAVGNHELVQPSGENYQRYLGTPGDGFPANDRRRFYRTMRWGNLRVFFLNAMDGATTGEEKAWLAGELTKSNAETGITFRIAVLHHGPFSSGPHGPNARLWNSGMTDVLREQRVDLVLSGHDHIYERGDAKGLKYIVSGGGGAPLYPIRKRQPSSRVAESVHHFVEVKVNGQELALVAKRVDGSTIDKCGFAKGGPWDCDKDAKNVAAAPASKDVPPAPSTPSASRCGCEVPGSSRDVGSLAVGSAAFVALAVARVRRRKS